LWLGNDFSFSFNRAQQPIIAITPVMLCVHCFLTAEEEKDVDDWDVDMSVYYDADGGDKDACDMVTMRRDSRRRTGRPDDETFESAIGKFERHSKVFSFSASLSIVCHASKAINQHSSQVDVRHMVHQGIL